VGIRARGAFPGARFRPFGSRSAGRCWSRARRSRSDSRRRGGKSCERDQVTQADRHAPGRSSGPDHKAWATAEAEVTGLATCADCGSSYFKERSVRPLCAHCEAADDAFRELMAERVRAERAWEATDLDELRAERDRLRPVDLPAKSQTTTSSGPGYE